MAPNKESKNKITELVNEILEITETGWRNPEISLNSISENAENIKLVLDNSWKYGIMII